MPVINNCVGHHQHRPLEWALGAQPDRVSCEAQGQILRCSFSLENSLGLTAGPGFCVSTDIPSFLRNAKGLMQALI